MNLLRLLLLTMALAGITFSQFVFDRFAWLEALPHQVREALPGLASLAARPVALYLQPALWIAALAALGFGAATHPWREFNKAPVVRHGRGRTGQPIALPWGVLTPAAMAMALSAYLFAHFLAGGPETETLHWLWLASILLCFLAAWRARRYWPTYRPRRHDTPRPERSWLVMLVLLALTLPLHIWALDRVPIHIGADQARPGLAALALARGSDELFSPADTALPGVAHVVTATAIRLTGSPLLGLRVAGVIAALGVVAATWLLGCELYRRTPIWQPDGELLDDDGRFMALLAAALLATAAPILYYARTPLYLEAIFWGMLGGWALLRGLRLSDPVAMTVAGAMTGMATMLSPLGWVFGITMPAWWLGVGLYRYHWIRRRTGGIGRWGLLFWLLGGAVMLAPLLGLWLAHPVWLAGFLAFPAMGQAADPNGALPALAQLLQTGALDDLPRTITRSPETTGRMTMDTPILNSILGPLFVLALGSLLLNLDRFLGWLLMSWFVVGVGLAVFLPGEARVLLLPLLPMTMLAIAFGLDRARLTLVTSGGSWLTQATLILALGLVLWSAYVNWLAYLPVARQSATTASYISRAVLDTPPFQPLYFVGEDESTNPADPAIQFAVAAQARTLALLPQHSHEWPERLPARSRILIAAQDMLLLEQVRAQYPGGAVVVDRDLHANPRLYRYDLP